MRDQLDLDRYFLRIAQEVSSRSTCLRHKMGAVLVLDRAIIATGYNGPPRGLRHCEELGGCARTAVRAASGQQLDLCRAVHAEMNAYLRAALLGVSPAGATLYCTARPCALCARLAINLSIARVVVSKVYPDSRAMSLFAEAGIPVIILPTIPRVGSAQEVAVGGGGGRREECHVDVSTAAEHSFLGHGFPVAPTAFAASAGSGLKP